MTDGYNNPRTTTVLFLINGLGTGGSERSLAETVPLLVRHNIDCVFACHHQRDEGVQESLSRQGFSIHFLRSATFPGRIREVRGLLIKHRPDVLHTTIFESDILGRIASTGFPVRVLTSLVNTCYDERRLADPNVSAWKLECARRLDGFTARHLTDHFHAVTRSVKDASIAALGIPSDRITVVERGRDPSRLGRRSESRRRKTRRALGLSDTAEVLLTVGRQEHQKGQKYLLEAVAAVARSRPNLRLLVAGREGNATGELLSIRDRLRLSDRIRFLGHREDVPDLLAAADLFVFPSLYEGIGGAALEAMALELPVVASRIPGMQEVLEEGENALLVPPEDSRSLAEAILHLLTDKDKAREFGRRGRGIFERRFTLERSAGRMAALYRNLVGSPPSHHQVAGV